MYLPSPLEKDSSLDLTEAVVTEEVELPLSGSKGMAEEVIFCHVGVPAEDLYIQISQQNNEKQFIDPRLQTFLVP